MLCMVLMAWFFIPMPYPQYGVSLSIHWVWESHANTVCMYNTPKLPLSRHIRTEGHPYLRTVHSLETWLILVQVLYRLYYTCTCMWHIILTCLDQHQDKAVERMTLLSPGKEFLALVLLLTKPIPASWVMQSSQILAYAGCIAFIHTRETCSMPHCP